MRFLMMHKSDEATEAGAPPDPELMVKMAALMEEATKAGALEATEGLHPSAKGARIKYEGGKFTITDGPFAEAKELVASYAIVNAASIEEAIQWSKRFYEVVGDGEGEIRQIYGLEDFGPPPEA